MTKRRRTYSFAFKQEVVAAIQAGQLTVAEARRQYGINGAMTIQKWIQKAEALCVPILTTILILPLPSNGTKKNNKWNLRLRNFI